MIIIQILVRLIINTGPQPNVFFESIFLCHTIPSPTLNRNYPVQNGYLNEQWSDDNGYHDNVTYDSRDETMYHDNNQDDRQDDHVRIEESNNESFERKEETSALSEDQPQLQEDDVFDNFKTGPFPKKFVY